MYEPVNFWREKTKTLCYFATLFVSSFVCWFVFFFCLFVCLILFVKYLEVNENKIFPAKAE